ncbi:MAG: pentapeptide repeat-containing protein, partial [Pirellulales bacterium]
TDADLTSANLTSANHTSANLTSANLTNADLRYANLRSADLTSANLRSAKWPKDATVLCRPVQIWGLRWPVTLFGSHLQIGCEVHSVREWEAFDDERILRMGDREAIEFWSVNKSRILAFRDVEAEDAFAAKQAAEKPVDVAV